MTGDVFHSSDGVRSAQPLRHAQTLRLAGPIHLEHGGMLPEVNVCYETYGRLNDRRDNAVLICHALSGDSHVARHDPQDDPGWWDIVVGPGKAIDTDRYFVICPNILGGCRGTTGPNSIHPATGKRYGGDFPAITVADMVQVQLQLVERLGIGRLHAVVGGSLGGQQALVWATRHSDRLRGVLAIATSPRLTSQALAFDVVGRNAILRDPHFHQGQYYDHAQGPDVGLALARMLGHITYLSHQAMMEKFDPARTQPRDVATAFEKRFSVGSYLAYQGHKFVERFDANSYVSLTLAMDMFDLGDSPGKLRQAMAGSACRWLVMSFSSDWLFPPFQSREMVDALIAADKPVTYLNVVSACGHDAFLLADDLPVYGPMMRSFLHHLEAESSGTVPLRAAGDADSNTADPTSIFHGRRLDYDQILQLIPAGASVLDVGCGNGELLALLKQRGHRRVMGVELDQREILSGAARGLDVVQADINEGLRGFTAGQFDVVVLSQTLQSITDTERVIDEMLRVGRLGIVSFPNFAYRKLREMLYREGRSPKAPGLYGYEWYNTPNRRFPSIADFEAFCAAKCLHVHRQVALDTQADKPVTEDPNTNADLAIFVISR